VTAALDVYGRALADPERPLLLLSEDGASRAAALRRWLGPVTDVDERVLERAAGPVLDVGCGPGRHVHALAGRGVLAVGVDVSPAAVRLARRRGVRVIEQSIFSRIPGAGSWRSALLLDGNVGIGARPAQLLARLASLLAPGGEVLVELDPPGAGVTRARVCLEHGESRSVPFDWATVAVDAIGDPARQAGFRVVESWRDGERWFARLRLRLP
jgi:SAM-dependent methyltransferase